MIYSLMMGCYPHVKYNKIWYLYSTFKPYGLMGVDNMIRRFSVIISLFTIFLLIACSADKVEKEEPVEEEETVEENVEAEETTDEEVENEEEQAEQEDEKEEATEEGKALEEAESDYPQGDFHIYIGGEVTETDDKILIEGHSNLIPGSRVVGEVSISKDTNYYWARETKEYEYLADTTELVDDNGDFQMEIDYHGIQGKETAVSVTFNFDGQQNDDVIRHYGDRGQNLEGSYIYQHRGESGGRDPKNIFKKAEVTTVFTTGSEKVVRQFKEPSWYEIPEDMGDSRVWLEVEEVNDDGEYFYVHGRSNLIEGSRIGIYRNHAREAETVIKPDGSFDFKFDYEYKEIPFLIQFKPDEYQWNIVEETYGAKGQNLVGNLVEKYAYNNEKQLIEYQLEDESQEIEVPDNVELNIDGSEVTMLVPDDVLFDFDEYKLKENSKKTLKEIATVLGESFNKKDLEIEIIGHTDNEGSFSYNIDLSKDRAEAVKTFFEKELKSSDITFTTEGLADAKPIASNDTESGRSKNRRVEILINLK